MNEDEERAMNEDEEREAWIAELRQRLADHRFQLEHGPAWKVGTRFWLDRLEEAARIRRKLDKLEGREG